MMSEKEREQKETETVRTKNYKAVLDMIFGPDELPECVQIILKQICHEPLEQLIYDVIINGGENDEPDTLEKINRIGADLYYVHTRLNQKLKRSSHYADNSCDEFLLGCIVNEIKKRKKDFMIESDDALKQSIYLKYSRTNYAERWKHLYPVHPDDSCKDFDTYVDHLFKKERNGLIEIHSINHLWGLLGLRRDYTFAKIRPTQNELYIFCVALSLDYDVYSRLEQFLKIEWSEISDEEREKKYRKRFKGFQTGRRDIVLKDILENIESWLDCAMSDIKSEENIPAKMLKNVNEELDKRELAKLTKNTGKN